jgi:hypothetical protein
MTALGVTDRHVLIALETRRAIINNEGHLCKGRWCMGPHGAAWGRMGPHGTEWDRHGTEWSRMGPHGAAPGRMGLGMGPVQKKITRKRRRKKKGARPAASC